MREKERGLYRLKYVERGKRNLQLTELVVSKISTYQPCRSYELTTLNKWIVDGTLSVDNDRCLSMVMLQSLGVMNMTSSRLDINKCLSDASLGTTSFNDAVISRLSSQSR